MPGSRADDIGVLGEQVHAGHPGLARKSRSDDDDIRTDKVFKVAGAMHAAFESGNRAGFGHIQGLSLRHALNDIERPYLPQPLLREQEGSCGTDIPGSDH